MRKHTPDEVADKDNIEKALIKMKEIADYLNASKKKSESKAKIAEIQQNLVSEGAEVCFASLKKRKKYLIS